MKNFRLEVGDCLLKVKELEANSIDVIITDPPYELNFFNQKWDNSGIVFKKETWKEFLRVLKPGGILLTFSHSKKQHRIDTVIEDAGFILRDKLMWLYPSGFPKAMSIPMLIDKKILKTPHQSKRLLNKILPNLDNPEYYENNYNSLSDEAKKWDGWKTLNLSPAYEPITLAQKPLQENYVTNILNYNIGAMNVDENRINLNNEKIDKGRFNNAHTDFGYKKLDQEIDNKGRFPKNVILTDDKKIIDLFSNSKSGYINSEIHNKNVTEKNIYNGYNNNSNFQSYGDFGSSARFFYCAKAHPIDREEGLKFEMGGGTKIDSTRKRT